MKNTKKDTSGTLPPAGVAILFVKRDSVYKTLGVDCWDIDRDALNWPGGVPCVAHPPCRTWGQLSHFAKPLPGEKELAFFAIDMIRKYGGVVEHPRASRLWPDYLPLPGKVDVYGGYSVSVDQFWWGHKAKKSTLLYIVGCPLRELPVMPMRFDTIQYTVSTSKGKARGRKKELPKKEREETPIDFAKWLIEIAVRARGPLRTSGTLAPACGINFDEKELGVKVDNRRGAPALRRLFRM